MVAATANRSGGQSQTARHLPRLLVPSGNTLLMISKTVNSVDGIRITNDLI
jgi:hypothetical protein